MILKNILGQIETYGFNCHWVAPLSAVDDNCSMAHSTPVEQEPSTSSGLIWVRFDLSAHNNNVDGTGESSSRQLFDCSGHRRNFAPAKLSVDEGGKEGYGLKTRNATEADADAIQALTREAYAKWIPVIGREPLPMTVDYHDAVRKHRFRLAHVGEALAALVETVTQADHVSIENLAVLPAFQGKGFGRKLLALVEETAKSEGVPWVRLYTNNLFAENVEFYSRHGYKTYCEEPFKGGMVVYMSKSVAESA